MSRDTTVVAFRQPEAIDDPLSQFQLLLDVRRRDGRGAQENDFSLWSSSCARTFIGTPRGHTIRLTGDGD